MDMFKTKNLKRMIKANRAGAERLARFLKVRAPEKLNSWNLLLWIEKRR